MRDGTITAVGDPCNQNPAGRLGRRPPSTALSLPTGERIYMYHPEVYSSTKILPTMANDGFVEDGAVEPLADQSADGCGGPDLNEPETCHVWMTPIWQDDFEQ